MKEGWRTRLLKRVGWSAALLAIPYATLLVWVWAGRVELIVKSAALDENRQITVFGSASWQQRSVVYSLDGQNHRHALLPTAHGLVIATLYGRSAPMFVAIHSGGKRDIDFRPAVVRPANWRPDLSGRSKQFDAFLFDELQPEIERRFGRPQKRYIFGHSLAGFYALDMAARRPQHGYAGLFAFSPTFSHDVSLLDRLGKACANTPAIYTNIGLESERDTIMFDRAERAIASNPQCKGRVTLAHHYGLPHQLIMLTGQIAAFRRIFSNNQNM